LIDNKNQKTIHQPASARKGTLAKACSRSIAPAALDLAASFDCPIKLQGFNKNKHHFPWNHTKKHKYHAIATASSYGMTPKHLG
jgi:hypothetical protein